MKALYILTAIITILLSCTKVENQKGLFIRGRLLLFDTITQSRMNTPLANKRVVLAENNGDSLNYLYADTTDADGYFLFDLLNDGKTSFVIKYEERVNSYLYTARKTISKGETDIAVQAALDTIKQNGFIIYAKDTAGGIIPGTTLRIYNSPVLAAINDPAGVVDSVTASNTGKIFKLNLPPGPYYLNARRLVADTILFQRIGKTIQLGSSGIQYLDSVRLSIKR